MKDRTGFTKEQYRTFTIVSSAVVLVAGIGLAIWGWKAGIFTSLDKLRTVIAGFGIYGPIIFVMVQIAQIMVPFIPGGVTCLAGVVLFGPWTGFWLNYLSIIAGSLLAFQLGRVFGKPLLNKMFEPQQIEKYEKWAAEKNRFAKLFAIAIILPGFPDDMLCWLAGTTDMSMAQYALIIVIGKPLVLAFYSLGIDFFPRWLA